MLDFSILIATSPVYATPAYSNLQVLYHKVTWKGMGGPSGGLSGLNNYMPQRQF